MGICQDVGEVAELVAEPDSVDLGSVVSGEVADAVFTWENRSSQELEIIRILTSCGCTIPSVSQRKFLPGDKAMFTLQLDSKDRQGEARTTALINYRMQDGQLGGVALRLRAQIRSAE